MSFFAINVKTGWEAVAIDHIQKMCEKMKSNSIVHNIKSIIAPILEVKKFVGDDVCLTKPKLLTCSYIYIQTNDSSIEISNELYHFLKQAKGVLKVLPYNIPQDEVESFLNNYQLALEEAEIEIQFEDEVEEINENQILHEANIAPIHEHKEKLKAERTVDKVKQLITQAKNKKDRLLSKCKAYIQRRKETYRFPLALFHKTLERIDPFEVLPNRMLTNPSFILPELIKTMEDLYKRNAVLCQ